VRRSGRRVLLPAWWILHGGTPQVPHFALINGVTGKLAGIRPTGTIKTLLRVCLFLFLALKCVGL
jgi:hypothetical protein